MNDKVKLMMHPIRMRLVTELSERQLTTRELAAALPDIPQATLYRQIKRLLDGGVFYVVEENVVNGAVERTYALVVERVQLTHEDVAGLSSEQHVEMFSMFAASLIHTFTRSMEKNADRDVKNVQYARTNVYLSDVERKAFEEKLSDLITDLMANQPNAERKRYALASVFLPDERL